MKRSIYEIQMAAFLKQAGYKFEEEYKFHPTRRWRFDFVILPLKDKIALEIDGAIWTGKGRHSVGKGFISDCEKYNQAQMLGWAVLRYTPETLTDVLNDLKILKQKPPTIKK